MALRLGGPPVPDWIYWLTTALLCMVVVGVPVVLSFVVHQAGAGWPLTIGSGLGAFLLVTWLIKRL